MRFVPVIVALALTWQAASAFAEEIRYIACPVYRDTDSGKKSGCWLADDPATGTRYDVSISPTKPDWNFQVLVEGTPDPAQKDVCGGVVLRPARVSVLRDHSCTRAMLPAEGHAGRVFVLPERNVHPLYAHRDAAVAPFLPREFAVTFDFGSDFVTYQLTDYYLDQLAYYAVDAAPVHVRITGFAATRSALVSGQRIVEPAALALARARKVAEWLQLRGVPGAAITVTSGSDPKARALESTDGLMQPSLRRAEVVITPDR